jgi:predicted transcriptional regulator
MAMRLCGEIMIPLERFPQLPYWFTLRQAMAELDHTCADENRLALSCRIVLVISAQNRLLGILRQQDILRGLKPALLAENATQRTDKFFDVQVDPNLYRFCGGSKALSRLQEQIERHIGDFARPIDVMLHHDDDLVQTIGLMIDRDLDLVPVLQDNKIAGIVTMLDVLQETTKLLI